MRRDIIEGWPRLGALRTVRAGVGQNTWPHHFWEASLYDNDDKKKKPNAVDFVTHFCRVHAKISYDRTLTLKGRPSNLKLLRGALALDNAQYELKHPEHVLAAALDKYLDEIDRAVVDDYVKRVAFCGSADDTQLRNWLRAVTGQVDDLDVATLKHFIWQVKRKMSNLPVEYHMMPVLTGRTGSGKSVAVERLVAPLKELVESGRDFSMFEDSREWHTFHRMYVVVFDEMSKAGKTDVDSMKKTITASNVSYRELGTHNTVNGTQVSTFIGTSNNHISEVIFDPTSARRFWQIQSQELVDWQAINDIDYLGIWQSVDEAQAASPVRPYWAAIQQVQHDEFRQKTPIEEWFAETYKVSASKTTKAGDAYQAFRGWAEVNNLGKQISSTKFARELQKIDGVQKEKHTDANYYNIEKQDGAVNPLKKVEGPQGDQG
jgi:predicted P-loop ATPase